MNDPKISVVMTVYDHARELEQQLPAYLAQDYEPGYEVIVVDESSTDDTDDVLTRQKHQLAGSGAPQGTLYTTFLPRPNPLVSRRRMALTIGLRAAKGKWTMFTDITTAPPSEKWLAELDEFTTNQAVLILGYIRKNGDVRLQVFNDISKARVHIAKAERRRTCGNQGKYLRYLRGKYDFLVVRTELGHELLRHYELDLRGRSLLSHRLRVMCYNLTH